MAWSMSRWVWLWRLCVASLWVEGWARRPWHATKWSATWVRVYHMSLVEGRRLQHVAAACRTWINWQAQRLTDRPCVDAWNRLSRGFRIMLKRLLMLLLFRLSVASSFPIRSTHVSTVAPFVRMSYVSKSSCNASRPCCRVVTIGE